jgi:hypothetical protein
LTDANVVPVLDSSAPDPAPDSGPGAVEPDAALDAGDTPMTQDAAPIDASSVDAADDGGEPVDSSRPSDVYDHLSPGEGLSSEPLCEQIEACGGDVEAKYRVLCSSRLGVRVTEACAAAVQAASCEEHAQENPAYMDVCHPRCDVFQHGWCNDDLTISSCSVVPPIDSEEGVSRWVTTSCARVCELGESVAVECRDEGDGEARCVCENDL